MIAPNSVQNAGTWPFYYSTTETFNKTYQDECWIDDYTTTVTKTYILGLCIRERTLNWQSSTSQNFRK